MIGATLIGISILIVCQMVLLRYVFNSSTTWQTDFVTFALVGATIIGSPYLLHTGAHVKVDLLTSLFSRARQNWFHLIANVAVFIVAIVFAVTGGQLTWEAFEGNWLSETVAEIPLWIPYSALPLGFGLLALQALSHVFAVIWRIEEGLPENTSVR